MTTKHKNRQPLSFVFDLLQQSKLKVILLGCFAFTAFLTGIIVAARTGSSFDDVAEFDIFSFGSGFWGRLFSMILVASICFGCSFTKFLFPLALLFLAYRGYLLGINITLIIVFNGLTGIVGALLVVLPCQLLALFVMLLMYILLCKTRKDCGLVSGTCMKQCFVIFLGALIFLSVVCILESLLFALFSPTVILIV
ncbi:MAG: hypothetical protein J6A28_03110 [Clostridia bacterium]|nr:hypothetical protein [Clostridia bacterium]